MSCYAAILGDCEGPIEREHWVPLGVQRLIPDARVSGFPWQHPGSELGMGIGSYAVARILCRRHHDELDGLDERGRDFLRNFNLLVRKEDERDTGQLVSDFEGRTLERWLLKVVCGAIASDATGKGRDLPISYVRALFGRDPWPDHWRFFVELRDFKFELAQAALNLDFVWAENVKLLGLCVTGYGFSSGLEFFRPSRPPPGVIYRPRRLGTRATSPSGEVLDHKLKFRWPEGAWVDPQAFRYPENASIEWAWELREEFARRF